MSDVANLPPPSQSAPSLPSAVLAPPSDALPPPSAVLAPPTVDPAPVAEQAGSLGSSLPPPSADTSEPSVDLPAPSTVTVVVVGSDPEVLSAARAATRRFADLWKVISVEYEDHVLQYFTRVAPVDIVIASGGGNGMGARVLDLVRKRSPRTARLALCDPYDEAEIARLAPLAHQMLSMPPDIGVLSELVGRVRHSARTGLLDPVRTLIGEADRLPSPPALFQRVNEMLVTDDWRMDALAEEIEKDPAITSELLKLVNSSFYGLGVRVTSVSRTISLIGTRMTRSVVLGDQLFRSSGRIDTWIDLNRLAARSSAVARASSALATRQGASQQLVASAYLAGLVSEIGMLVLARIPDIEPSIAAPVNNSFFLGAERVLFGGDRFEAGAHLLTLWGFDADVIDAVERLSHGKPSPSGGLAWLLASARHLVIEDEIHPDRIAWPHGTDEDVDKAIARCLAVQAAED
ncbi:MAG: HDOD domain-containing protein [Ilumatobacter sp.]